MIVASVINFGFCRPDDPVEVTDFIPGAKKELDDLTQLSPDEQAKHVMKMFSKKKVTHRG